MLPLSKEFWLKKVQKTEKKRTVSEFTRNGDEEDGWSVFSVVISFFTIFVEVVEVTRVEFLGQILPQTDFFLVVEWSELTSVLPIHLYLQLRPTTSGERGL